MATMSIAGAVRPLLSLEVVNLPLGKALALPVIAGVGDFVAAFARNKFPTTFPVPVAGKVDLGLAIPVALAFALNFGPVKKIVGNELAELGAIALLADAANDYFNVQKLAANWLGKLAGGIVVSASPSRFIPNNATLTVQPQPFQSNAGGGDGLYATLR